MKAFVNFENKKWAGYKINFDSIVDMVARVMNVSSDAEVSITLTDDKHIHKLNREYRNIDKPTNVLSFELGDDILLGDIFISLDTVAREADVTGITVAEHTAHMVVHGILHLLGYDHLNDAEANKMESMEIKILDKMGIKNPYSDDIKCTCPGDGFLTWLRRRAPRENGFWQYVMLALLGAISALGFAPFNMWYMTIFGIMGAYALLTRPRVAMGGFWRRLLRAAPFGAAYGLAMFWWTLHSIYVVPELAAQFAIWTAPGVIGLALAGVVMFGTPFAIATKFPRNHACTAILFASGWTTVLWLREWFLTGFPWNPIANIALPMPVIANSMSLFGALGLTFLIMLGCGILVEIMRMRRSGILWVIFALDACMIGIGAICGYINIVKSNVIPDGTQKIIRIVQPARSQSQKMVRTREDAIAAANENIEYMIKLARDGAATPDLIVFPETAYPYAIVPNDKIDMAQDLGTDVIIGANAYDGVRMYNSMIVANARGEIQNVYHKSHLVPFGEYRPLGFLPAPANLGAGDGPVVLSAADIKFAPAICYEIIFSDSLVPYDAIPNMIINITNDTWFGTTPGVYQHLSMVRRYAIESGLPIVRANYSGVSAFVSPSGDIISALPVGAAGHLDGFVWGAHKTAYRAIGRDWMMIIILVVSIGLCRMARRA